MCHWAGHFGYMFLNMTTLLSYLASDSSFNVLQICVFCFLANLLVTKNVTHTERTSVKKLCKSKQILRASFLKWVLVGCQNIAGLLNLSTSYLTCSQIWLIHLVGDHRYGYITTLEGKNAW